MQPERYGLVQGRGGYLYRMLHSFHVGNDYTTGFEAHARECIMFVLSSPPALGPVFAL